MRSWRLYQAATGARAFARPIGGVSEANCREIMALYQAATGARAFARPIGGVSEANCREIIKMVEPIGIEPTTS